MPPELGAFFLLIGGVGAGIFALVGFRMLAEHREKMQQARSGNLDGLEQTVDRLADQVERLTQDVGELHERVDFAERLLTEGSKMPGAKTPT